jgi:hypothetical protein
VRQLQFVHGSNYLVFVKDIAVFDPVTFSLSMFFLSLKAGLHYGDYRSKLVPLEAQRNIFYI